MGLKELMATDPPRLVVPFQHGPDGQEQFKWGIVGQMPALSLLGYIIRVQADLAVSCLDGVGLDLPPSRYCEEQVLIVVWDAANKSMTYFVHPQVPIDPMIGMLETIKAVLMGKVPTRSSSNIVGPDGKPL